MEPIKVNAIIIGGILGILLVLIPKFFPRAERFLPSPIGFGLAWAIQWNASFLFFLGALIAWYFDIKMPKKSREFKIPTASGLIAGASLTGIALLIWDML